MTNLPYCWKSHDNGSCKWSSSWKHKHYITYKVTNTENKDDWQQTSQFKRSLISLAGTMSHDQHKNITFLVHINLILVSEIGKTELRLLRKFHAVKYSNFDKAFFFINESKTTSNIWIAKRILLILFNINKIDLFLRHKIKSDRQVVSNLFQF